MKRKLAIVTGVGLAAGLVSGCGGGGSSGNQAMVSPGGSGSGSTGPLIVSWTTQDNLHFAQMTSETAVPYAVDNGALILTDTSETAEPININGM